MSLNGARMQDIIERFRQVLPEQCATAHAIDHREPWDKIATTAIDDGYVEVAEEFSCLVEACLRRFS